ncbi:MAG: competence protein CoiA [Peptostreptococcaceae bacterium]
MYIALDKDNNRITIDKASKDDKYYCPLCGSELIPKMGKVNKHHFAHKDTKNCDTWSDMSEWHREWQELFPEDNREVVIENHRADILKDNWVVEFQHSPISQDELNKRIDFYTRNNKKLIFLFDKQDKDIYEVGNKDMFYNFKWINSSRSIIPPNNSNYFVLFQIESDKLIWIRSKNQVLYNENGNICSKFDNDTYNWGNFLVYSILTKSQFIEHFTNLKDFSFKKEQRNNKYLTNIANRKEINERIELDIKRKELARIESEEKEKQKKLHEEYLKQKEEAELKEKERLHAIDMEKIRLKKEAELKEKLDNLKKKLLNNRKDRYLSKNSIKIEKIKKDKLDIFKEVDRLKKERKKASAKNKKILDNKINNLHDKYVELYKLEHEIMEGWKYER